MEKTCTCGRMKWYPECNTTKQNGCWKRFYDDSCTSYGFCDECGNQLMSDGSITIMVEQHKLQWEHALWKVLEDALEYGNIEGGMYRERTLDGEKIGEDSPMWYGPIKRNGANISARELACELFMYGFRSKE